MMKMMRFLLTSLILTMVLVSCGPANGPGQSGTESSGEPGVAMTTFYPLAYFARRIAGDAVEVQCTVPDDADPSLWQPGADAIQAYQQAEVIFVNGASFEKWIATAPLPRSRIVDTTAGLKDELLHYVNATTHSHGPAGKHSHEGIDGHTWLDPVMALAQAQAVRDGLKRAYPESAAEFDTGFAALAKDLKALDESLRELAGKMDGVTVIATHPAYNYLARRYDWNLINVTIDPLSTIEDAVFAEALGKLEQARFASGQRRVAFWEVETSEANQAKLADGLGAQSMVWSPVETRPGGSGSDEDFLSGMRANIARLRGAIEASRGTDD
jgi:zinc transport system substrate-binding protein